MNDSQEPSYYEIALTNRQVLVFFVVLLLSVVGAFFSGVWLGQQRAGDLPTIAQAPVLEKVEPDEEALAELNFFTDDKPAASSSKAAESKPSDSNTAGSGKAEREAVRQEPVAAVGSPATTLLEDVSGSPRKETSQRTAVEPGLSEPNPAEPAPTPAPVVSPATLPPAGGYVIQVFSSPDGGQAGKLLERLTSGGYDAFLSPVEVKGRTMHRVRIGPFPSKGEADTTAAEVAKAFRVDTWVTRNE